MCDFSGPRRDAHDFAIDVGNPISIPNVRQVCATSGVPKPGVHAPQHLNEGCMFYSTLSIAQRRTMSATIAGSLLHFPGSSSPSLLAVVDLRAPGQNVRSCLMLSPNFQAEYT